MGTMVIAIEGARVHYDSALTSLLQSPAKKDRTCSEWQAIYSASGRGGPLTTDKELAARHGRECTVCCLAMFGRSIKV